MIHLPVIPLLDVIPGMEATELEKIMGKTSYMEGKLCLITSMVIYKMDQLEINVSEISV